MIKNISIFENYQKNLEYDFETVNELSLGYMAESLKCDFEMLNEFEQTNDNIEKINKKINEEKVKYQLKEEKLSYIVNYFNDNKNQLDNMKKRSQEEMIKWMNENIN